MTVAELGQRMDAAELAEWQAYYHLDPWDGFRGDINAAFICQQIWNVWGNKTKASEFMPEFKPKRRMTAEEERMMFEYQIRLHNQLAGVKGK